MSAEAPITLAVPCRADEPALGRTLRELWSTFDGTAPPGIATLVCVNGAAAAEAPACGDLAGWARERGRTLVRVDADVPGARGLPDGGEAGPVVALLTRRAGKAIAWNLLRRAVRTEVVVFADADVGFGPRALPLLLEALRHHPDAVLASPKTTCAARPTAFERVMASPYGVDFPNLSGQLYAARTAGLPAVMPEDLIEPERWLELEVGRTRVVREPAARVVVRLPATLRDFYRQRIRIEMGKVQLARDYPGLGSRGQPQPRGRAALASLRAGELARLGAYLVLRESAHAVAWWRYRRGRTAGVWVQAASTKQWGGG